MTFFMFFKCQFFSNLLIRARRRQNPKSDDCATPNTALLRIGWLWPMLKTAKKGSQKQPFLAKTGILFWPFCTCFQGIGAIARKRFPYRASSFEGILNQQHLRHLVSQKWSKNDMCLHDPKIRHPKKHVFFHVFGVFDVFRKVPKSSFKSSHRNIQK